MTLPQTGGLQPGLSRGGPGRVVGAVEDGDNGGELARHCDLQMNASANCTSIGSPKRRHKGQAPSPRVEDSDGAIDPREQCSAVGSRRAATRGGCSH